MSLLDEAIAAHGGLDAWRRCERLTLHLSSWGPAFSLRGRPDVLRDVTASVRTSGQEVVLEPFGQGARAVFTGPETRLVRADGEVIERTDRPRGARWRAVDAAAFAGGALWTYVAFPFALVDDAAQVRELRGRRLEVTLHPPLVAHARRHLLHLDERGLIRRHDYTPEAFGPWARAANVVLEHRELGGVVLGARRWVTPRLLGRPLPGPVLVRIEISPAAGPGAEA